MKKYILVSTLVLGMFGAFASTSQQSTQKPAKESKKEEYACPMKCEGKKTYTKKGKCPACTMDLKLVKK
ncbi:heavy metal-binding domain-containing protein [Aquirufa sp. A-Brett2-15D]